MNAAHAWTHTPVLDHYIIHTGTNLVIAGFGLSGDAHLFFDTFLYKAASYRVVSRQELAELKWSIDE